MQSEKWKSFSRVWLCDPMDYISPWNSSGQNTRLCSLSLLQGIFPTQGSNPSLPQCRQILYQLSHKGSPKILEWVAYPFSSGYSWPRNLTRVSSTASGFFINWSVREAQDTELYKKDLNDPDNHDSVITHLDPDIQICEVKWDLEGITMNKARWRWWNSSWAISNSKRWCCESAALSMPPNLENSAAATRLEKISFHSNPKERQHQRMFKLSHRCAHFTC